MEQALQRYALLEHVTDDALSTDPRWIQMDSVVLNWINNSISADLHQVVRERGCTACHLWLAIENQFLGNREHCTLHLDGAFRTFVQGDLSVNEYCRKFKAMADGLADLGAPVDDRILILNILRGLNQRFEHVSSIIRRYSPFLNFLKVQDDLLLEELHMDSTGPSVTPTTLYTNIASPAAKPPSSTLSHQPHGGNGGTSGNRSKYHNKNRNSGNGDGHNDKNSTGDEGCGVSSSQSTAPTGSDGRTNAPWPTYGYPWQGHMNMYPGPMPVGQQCPISLPMCLLNSVGLSKLSSATMGVSLTTLPPASSSCRTTHGSGRRFLTRPHKMVKLNVLFVRLTMSLALC
jgi:hypothetical protein